MKKILSADPHLKAVTLLKNLVEIKLMGKKKKLWSEICIIFRIPCIN